MRENVCSVDEKRRVLAEWTGATWAIYLDKKMRGSREPRTFRLAEWTSIPREIAETALAHTNRDRVESAYLHSDHLEKRFQLMAEWAKFCATKPTKATVTSLTSKAKK